MMYNETIKTIKTEIKEESEQDVQYYREDEFILEQNSDTVKAEVESTISEMPSSNKRKSKKKKKLSKSKSSKKKLKKVKKKRKKGKSKKAKSEKVNSMKKLPIDIGGKNATIPIKLDQKMRSMALLEYSDAGTTAKKNTKSFIELQDEKPTSSSLFDEILQNQMKMYQKESKNQLKNEILPTIQISNSKVKKMTAPTNNIADVNESIHKNEPLDNLPLVHYSTIPIPPAHSQLNIPPQIPPTPSNQQHQPFLMAPPDPNFAILQGMSILKNTFPLGLFNNIGGIGIPSVSQPQPNNLRMPGTGMNSQPPLAPDGLLQMPPHLVSMLGGQHKAPPPPLAIGLNESLFDQTIQQQHFLATKPPLPVPPPPLPQNPNATIDPLIPPPPPPPHQIQSTSRCGLDSPMDIECDETAADDSSNKRSNDHQQKTKKKRSRNVQIADELMKTALKPYFARRKITKDEYKDIMKRGVAKLSKCQYLRPEKVEKFVEKYVNSVRKERGNRQFR